MKTQNTDQAKAATLRQKAEEQLKKQQVKPSHPATEADMLKLIHELQVHQIELELQNEELILANERAMAATEKYTELYDFAPSGYFTLNKAGKIVELNLHGAKMLGKERSKLMNSLFDFFIKVDSRDVFATFLNEIFQGKSNAVCDVPLITNGDSALHVHLTGIISDNQEQCRVTVTNITERKKAEDDLKKNLAKYQVLIDTFPIAITISNKAGNIIETNEKALELLGLSRDEHLNRKLKGEEWKIIRTDGTTFPQDEYPSVKALKENRLVENVEMGIVKSDNETTWINVTAAPIPIKELGVVIAYNDITERKLLEEKIQKTQERFKALVDVSLTGIWTTDPFGNNTYVSPQWSQITGISPENAKGDGWSFGLHPDDRETVLHGWKQAALNNKPYISDFRFISPDGGEVWVLCQATAVKDNDDKIIEWIGTITDITERKLSEEVLRTSKQLLEDIINNAPVRIFWKDRNLVFQGCNIEFAKDAGFSNPDEIIGKDDYQMVWHKQAELYRGDDLEVIESGKSKLNIEEPHTTAEGNKITVLTNKIPLRSAEGKVEGILGIYLDITQRKQMENALRENEERLRLALKATRDVVWDWDIANDKQRWNEAGTKVFGWTEIVENTVNAAWWVDRIHPDDRQRVEKGFFDVVEFAAGEIWHDEYRFLKADGTYADVLDRGYVLRDNQGKAVRMIGAMLDITERKKIDKFIQEEELKFRTVADFTYDWEYWQLPGGKLNYMSPSCERITGYSKNDFLSDPYLLEKIVHPDDLEAFKAHFLKTNSEKLNFIEKDFIFRIVKKDSAIAWIEHICRAVFDDNNQYLGRRVSNREITQRKLDEDVIKQHNIFLQTLINTIPAPVFFKDVHGRYLSVNKSFENFYGIIQENITGKTVFEIAPPEFANIYNEKDMELIQNPGMKQVYETKLKSVTGKVYDVIFHKAAFLDSGNRVQGLIGIILDISERKKTEIALKESELFANTIANTTPALLYLYDFEQAKNIWTNEVHKRFFEEINNDASGFQFTDIVQLIHPDDIDSVVAHHSELVDAGSIARFNTEIRIKWRDAWKWMRHIVTVFKTNDDGKPVQILGALFDIDDQKKTEQDLLEAKEKAEESDRLKSAFLANMSHEIRTPMNGILGFAELLKEPELSGEQQARYISIIEKSGARMLSTINDIIDFSKIESGLMEITISETNINNQFDDIYNFFKPEAEAKGLALTCNKSFHDDKVYISTDAEKLYAILTNLVKNAIKFTSKGSVEFGYKIVETLHATSLQFYVKDTGIGIPPNRINAIFDRFIQADVGDKRAFQGSGLGLTISKAYVEMLGGKIWVESHEENPEAGLAGGTTFYFTIPLVFGHDQNRNPENDQEDMPAEFDSFPDDLALKILIVEDEEDSNAMLAAFLQNISREILIAKTGFEAIELCRRHPDLDLVLMDIKMPDMNGYEATRTIRTFDRKVVIVAQTAYALYGDREKSIEAGCDDYISKPINKKELFWKIQKLNLH